MKRILLLTTLLLFLIPLTPGFAQNETPVSDDEVNRLASELYCPVCENIPLEVCPTKACAQWRELIREKLALGWSDNEIKTYFAAQYGDQVLALPPRRGLNWAIYLLPPLFVAGGIIIVIRIMRKSKKPGFSQPLSVENPRRVTPEDYINLVEKDLKGSE
ncbi:MAG TPA: cytochrome c-type biogenesis protein CcmH [Anaerolineaceae bacterium]|nr:cytochrome c-type biogenesis protein CcmH [Anaerolineaceae bacterium]